MKPVQLLKTFGVAALLFGFAIPPLRAQMETEAEPIVHRSIVPVAGHIPGWGGIEWQSVVRIANPSEESVFVGVTMIGGGFPSIAFSLEPGQDLELSDIVGNALGSPGAVGPLEINTLGGQPADISAFAIPYVEGRPGPMQPIPVMQTTIPAGLTILPGLVVDTQYRTTLGLCNLGTEPATVTIGLQLIEGRVLAWSTLALPPETTSHAPIQDYFPLLLAADYVMIVVDSPVAGVLAYASVIDNTTHKARFVSPRIPRSANSLGAPDGH